MIVGVPVESHPGERRVAMVPVVLPSLARLGVRVLVQEGAGEGAGFSDSMYEEQGARVASDRRDLFSSADVVLTVRGIDREADLGFLRPGQMVLGLLNPLGNPEVVAALAGAGVTAFALELLPRITRAQRMDALTSMGTIVGYKAALLAAGSLRKIYPMMITPAGTIAPARVLVVGAGVAGLQAIATSRRLGAVVQAYDVRPAVKEQVESLGAKFVELGLETDETEGAGGYARALGEEFYRRQREMMTRVVAESDVVITTAAVPGKRAPVLVTGDMVRMMHAGSVIVDLAAEAGGNCELTRPGETIEVHGVTVLGPVNLASTVPEHASQMYARNVVAFLEGLIKDGEVHVNLDDDILRGTLVTHQGEVVSPGVREALGLPVSTTTGEGRSNL